MASTLPLRTFSGYKFFKQSSLAFKSASCPTSHLNACMSSKEAALSVLVHSPVKCSLPHNVQKAPSPLVLSDLLSVLSINDRSIKLPEISQRIPLVPPSLSLPLELPQTDSNTAKDIVAPWLSIIPVSAPEPSSQSSVKKHCVRDIVIRRKKLKKARRKKERKRNKVSHEQRILRDIARKETLFQNEQGLLLSEAESFDAEKFVSEKLAMYNHKPIPKFFRGKRLPEAEMIKEFRKRGLKLPGEDTYP